MKKARLMTLFCLILTVGCLNPARADISGARDVVVSTINHIYHDITVDYDSEEALRASVADSVERHLTPALDFERFTKLILAKHWKGASVEQRERFTDILRGYLYRTLTKAIIEHKQVIVSYRESLDVKPAKPGRNEDRAIVSVVVDTGSEGKVYIDFRMGRINGAWQAYDVIVQDVSFAINYRAILNSEIKRHGIEEVAESFASKLTY